MSPRLEPHYAGEATTRHAAHAARRTVHAQHCKERIIKLERPAGRPGDRPWQAPALYWPSLAAATAHLDTPVAVVSREALAHNAHDLLDRRATNRPVPPSIRVATKSLRVRGIIEAVEAMQGYHGVLAYTLPEALWLAETIQDVVVGYPTADRAALAKLGASDELAGRVTLMVDSVEGLDLIDSVVAPRNRHSIRVCLELDAAWNAPLLGHTGAWRSPVHSVDDARSLAQHIVERPGFDLVGLMAYEGQIAGTVDRPAGRPVFGAVVRWMQRNSAAELAERRAAVVAAVREVAKLEFVNGGGTGSIETTSAERAITEIAAGSGLFGPHLFDHYTRFRPAPAAALALSVVRKPRPDIATVLGGGWIASGPPAPDRVPLPVWPEGLRMVAREMAGEVQTPLTGASGLTVGDRVWFRHTKSGEFAEHVNEISIIEGDRVIDTLP
ncbi:MAG TPA: alanine racemase, partial [Terrimesophilobacter sp.]|nr:alanine racemase [Terrimesophilobacter sp.]